VRGSTGCPCSCSGAIVGRRANHHALAGELERFLVDFGDPKVGQQWVAVAADQNVGRLDIAMDDPLAMGIGQRLGYLADQCGGAGDRQRLAGDQPLRSPPSV